MPKKRPPLVIEGQTVVLDAPGLEERAGGKRFYWRATKEARQRGYTPELVRLHGTLTTLVGARAIEQLCQDLNNQMLAWVGDPDVQSKPLYDGTVHALIRCYQTDPLSPYHGLRHNTRRGYDGWCTTLDRAAGARRIDKLTGQDMRNLFNEIMKPSTPGGPPRVRLAKAVVRQMMPILLNYGAESRLPGCLDLAMVMERMTLRVPDKTHKAWRASRPKKVAMAYTQAEAIIDEALRRFAATGEKKWRSVALGNAAQFEFTLRQIDVIGEFEPLRRGVAITPDMIVRLRKLWGHGLMYEMFADGTLDFETSKNGRPAVFEPDEYPLFVKALAAVPLEDRHGPLVVDNDGDPMFSRFYTDLYREVADAVGVPANVWNARARHGGLSEGYEALMAQAKTTGDKAVLDDLRFHGQHGKIETTVGHYIVPGAAPTTRVARARVATRPRKESA